MIPACGVRGLTSLLAIGGVAVTLLAYQKFKNVPEKVNVVNAKAFLTRAEFENFLESGVELAVAADLVRMLAIKQSAMKFAWLWDCDCLALRTITGVKPDAWGLGDESFGFVFATIGAKPGVPKDVAVTELRWAKNGLTKPRDKRYLTSPFRFPVGTPLIQELIDDLAHAVSSASSENPAEYNVFMNIVQERALTWGLEDAFLDEYHASSMGPWCAGKTLLKKHVDEFPCVDVMARSLCVNYYAQRPPKIHATLATQMGADSRAKAGSAWWTIMQHVDRLILESKPCLEHSLDTQPIPVLQAGTSSQNLRRSSVEWPQQPAFSNFAAFPSMDMHCRGLLLLQERFALQRQIGHGTFGIVYEALHRDPAISQPVAIKVVLANDEMDTLPCSEWYMLQRVASEHVTKLLDAWFSPHMSVLVLF